MQSRIVEAGSEDRSKIDLILINEKMHTHMKNSWLKILLYSIFAFVVLSITACDSEEELSEEDFVFDGPLGSDGTTIQKIEKNVFKVVLGRAPNHPDWGNKLNFQIKDNAKGNNLVLVVEGPPRLAMNEYFYSWSYDKENWNPVHWNGGYKISPERDTLLFPAFQQNQVWVGHQVPISYDQVEEYIQSIQSNNNVNVDTVGKSLGGRNLYRITITDQTSTIPAKGKWVHYFTNPHPGEHNAQWRMIGKINWLLSEEGKNMRKSSICHFVLMMSPDAPHKGWYRVNSQGVDMNRSYFSDGSDSINQTHESYILQRDLENIMASESPVTTLWGEHTWQGPVEPLMHYVEDKRLPPWTEWRDALLELDEENLIRPLALIESEESYGALTWEYGPHLQFNITTILCEGGGAIYTKEDNMKSGKILMESLGKFYNIEVLQ